MIAFIYERHPRTFQYTTLKAGEVTVAISQAVKSTRDRDRLQVEFTTDATFNISMYNIRCVFAANLPEERGYLLRGALGNIEAIPGVTSVHT